MSRFPGYYLSGDGGYIDEDGYVFIMGRVDDVINVAGHRLSTGEMEEIVGRTLPWPNVPWWALPATCVASARWVWWCSKTGRRSLRSNWNRT